jgi:hypothetical protein
LIASYINYSLLTPIPCVRSGETGTFADVDSGGESDDDDDSLHGDLGESSGSESETDSESSDAADATSHSDDSTEVPLASRPSGADRRGSAVRLGLTIVGAALLWHDLESGFVPARVSSPTNPVDNQTVPGRAPPSRMRADRLVAVDVDGVDVDLVDVGLWAAAGSDHGGGADDDGSMDGSERASSAGETPAAMSCLR